MDGAFNQRFAARFERLLVWYERQVRASLRGPARRRRGRRRSAARA
jgi:hypothetical protein